MRVNPFKMSEGERLSRHIENSTISREALYNGLYYVRIQTHFLDNHACPRTVFFRHFHPSNRQLSRGRGKFRLPFPSFLAGVAMARQPFIGTSWLSA